MPKVRVLVVDDSSLVRRALSQAIEAAPDLEVVGTAIDPFDAREKLLALKPDVMTLDLEMPRLGGLSFLRQLMQLRPLPVIVISSLTQPSCEASLEALRLGAVDVIAKPGGSYSLGNIAQDLPAKLRAAAQLGPELSRKKRNRLEPGSQQHSSQAGIVASTTTKTDGGSAHVRPGVIAIGASTGGTEAIAEVLKGLPASIPPIVITQHIPSGFSLAFATRLNRLCAFSVKEATDGDEVHPGRALIAPGGFHMALRGAGRRLYVNVIEGPEVCYQRPSVDVLFQSVAQTAGPKALGVLLTGMGMDGAHGLLAMRQKGAVTIAQDEATSVVFGMPKEAIRLGAASQVLSLRQISGALLQLSSPMAKPSPAQM